MSDQKGVPWFICHDAPGKALSGSCHPVGTSILRQLPPVSCQREYLYLDMRIGRVSTHSYPQSNTSADQWKYLTTEQALEDVVFFSKSINLTSTIRRHAALANSYSDGISVHPSVTPWIWVGGSYPGIRGALLRVRNPETIYAVWASSAPVQAQIDMAAYYKAAERSLTRNCSADWVAVTKHIDQTLSSGTTDQQIALKQRLLSARASSPNRNVSVSRQTAQNATNLQAAEVLMDPLNFYQVSKSHYKLPHRCRLIILPS